MSTRTALALAGIIIILGLGAFILRRQAEAPTTSETLSPDTSLSANVPPANPALLPRADIPPAPGAPSQPLPPQTAPAAAPGSTAADAPPSATMIIHITASGFAPAIVTLKSGTRVTFQNESAGDSWPASAMHPTHRVYPGSDIMKCGTTEKNVVFDSCGGIAPGAMWSFTFTERGSWKYHDHLSPSRTGTIVVE